MVHSSLSSSFYVSISVLSLTLSPSLPPSLPPRLADPNSTQDVLWCRGGKALEAYETLRSHIFAWHDSGVFTSCGHCNRVYQNTRAFLSHG